MTTREQAIANLPTSEEISENSTTHGVDNSEIKNLRGLVRCKDNCPVHEDCVYYEDIKGTPCKPNAIYINKMRAMIESKMGGACEEVDYMLVLDNAMYNIGMLFQMQKWIYEYGAVIKEGAGTGVKVKITVQPLIENGIDKMQKGIERSLKVLGLPRKIIENVKDISSIEAYWQGETPQK